MKCYVATKAEPYARWKRVSDHDDVGVAVGKAKAMKGYEVAVFVDTKTGGAMYWTSKFPALMNHPVLKRGADG